MGEIDLLKIGVISIDSQEYTLFLQECKSSTRLEICEPGTKFHVQPDKLLYGEYIKRTTKVFGNKKLGKEFLNAYSNAKHLKNKSNTVSKWENGAFMTTSTLIDKDTDNIYELVKRNGIYCRERFKYNNVTGYIEMYDDNNEFILEPLNLNSYTEKKLEAKKTNVQDMVPYYSAEYLIDKYGITWRERKDYGIISDVNEAEEYFSSLPDDYIIGGDTETTTLDFNVYSTDSEIVGVVVSKAKDEARYFPFGHTTIDNLPISFLERIVYHFNRLRTVAHNKKYDAKVFMKYDLKVNFKEDTMLIIKILKNSIFRGANSLKNLGNEITGGEKYLELHEVFIDKSLINFRVLPKELIELYACPDADNTRQAFFIKYEELPKKRRFIYEQEVRLADVKAEMEYWGFRKDDLNFFKEHENCTDTVVTLKYILNTLIGTTDIKLNSAQAIGDLLYKKLNYPIHVRTKLGKGSTSSAALSKLASEKLEETRNVVQKDIVDSLGRVILKKDSLNTAKYPIILVLERYRVMTKLLSSFYNRIVKGSITDRYMFWINQNGALSGRQSSPVHQFNSTIKSNIIADSDDHYLVDTDYSAIELRILAWLSGEKKLIDFCNDPNIDIHRAIGEIISGTPQWAIDSWTRYLGKRRNFGVVYLIGGYSLAGQMFGANPTKENVKFAKKSIEEFMLAFKRVALFLANNRKKLLKNGAIETFFNRVRFFDKLFDPNISNSYRESMIRQGNNTPVQGTAADILKMSEILMHDYIHNKGWDKLVDTPQGKVPYVRMMISVHDAILCSIHKSIPYVEILKMYKYCMELDIEGCPKLFASPACLSNWAEGKEDQYTIPIGLRDKMIEEYDAGIKWQEPFKDTKNEMLDIINEYRDNEITEYMEGLINKAGSTDISHLVRHPTLTHELIARFPLSKDDKKKFGKLSHIDQITYSTEKYIESRGSICKGDYTEKDEDIIKATKEFEIEEELKNLSEELFYEDNDGNIHYIGIEDESDEDLPDDEEVNDIVKMTNFEVTYVYNLFNQVVIDCNGLNVSQLEVLKEVVSKYNVDDGFSNIVLLYCNDFIETNFRIDEICDEMKEGINAFISDNIFDRRNVG